MLKTYIAMLVHAFSTVIKYNLTVKCYLNTVYILLYSITSLILKP